MSKGIYAHRAPQLLVGDSRAALNPSRRGVLGHLVAYLRYPGVEPITGIPYKPTTQGKNERFHLILFRYLDKQQFADTLGQLQAEVDAFDVIYNHKRPHQELPDRSTPLMEWQATPLAEASHQAPSAAAPKVDADIRMTPVRDAGTIVARIARLQTSRTLAGSTSHIVE